MEINTKLPPMDIESPMVVEEVKINKKWVPKAPKVIVKSKGLCLGGNQP
jgi:hypothetical protein